MDKNLAKEPLVKSKPVVPQKLILDCSYNLPYLAALYTDGIIDQLGGEKRIPFGNKRFVNLLQEISNETFEEQQNNVVESFECYKGKNDVQDGITVIGFAV